MFPTSSSLTRRLASLHRIARGSLLRLPRYHQGVPTSCRPFRPTHFSFVWRYHALLPVMRKRGVAVSGSLSELRRCLNPLPSPALVETSRISQVPGQPLREHALLFDPGGPDASGHCDTPDVAFRSVDDVGSAIGHLSRLNHTACSLAVYASRLGLLRSHHARLASRRRPTLAGQDLNLLGCFRRFLHVMSLHITSIPLRQALPGAPTAAPLRLRHARPAAQLSVRSVGGRKSRYVRKR
jgi:hypothetical protein